MRYKKRHIDAQTINQGGGKFMLYIGGEHVCGHRYGIVCAPFWARVSTKDLKEDWTARFFQQKIKASSLTYEEASPHHLAGQPCSFNSMPKVWQELFAPILDKILKATK